MPASTPYRKGQHVDDELKEKWDAEDRAFKEKLEKETGEIAKNAARESTEWQDKVGKELGLTHYEPTMSEEEDAKMIQDALMERELERRKVIKSWANRIDHPDGAEPDKGRSN